jgi:hypothetical protein
MSDAYTDLKTSLYNSYSQVVKDIPIIFAYQNGTQPKTTFMSLDIISWEAKGKTYASTHVIDERQTLSQVYEVRVRVEIHNPSEEDEAPNKAHQLDADYEGWLFNETVKVNNLSYMRRGSMKRVPKIRDTKWYMSFQQDVYFAFQFNNNIHTPAVNYILLETDAGDLWIPEPPPN